MISDLLIEPADLDWLIRKNEVITIDCRFSLQDTEWGRNEYQNAHIPGAYYVHLDEDLSSKVTAGHTGRHPLPRTSALQAMLRSFGVAKDSYVVVYDQSSGGIAARAWWLMKWAGIDRVKMLNGGWEAWEKAGLPVTDTVPSSGNSDIVVEPGKMPAIEMAEVAGYTRDDHAVLIDARARERYLGLVEPLDPVAGHIPGAGNIPWMSHTLGDGRWRDVESITRSFKNAGVDGSQKVVVYCGSGVTACHLAFAYELTGLGRAVIYPGSWSEWITDRANPVATGEE